MNLAVDLTHLRPLAVGPEEAARLTGHSRTAIFEAVAKGELKSFKSGKRRLFLVSELETWLTELAARNSR